MLSEKNIRHSVIIVQEERSSASASAILRVASAQHFPSDVIVGAIIGSGISYAICKFHHNKKVKLSIGINSVDISYKF